jgi:hypothetical protein
MPNGKSSMREYCIATLAASASGPHTVSHMQKIIGDIWLLGYRIGIVISPDLLPFTHSFRT